MLLLVHFTFLIQTSNLLANQSAPPRGHNCFSAVPPLPGSKPPPSESTVLPAPSGLVTYLPSFKRESQTSQTLLFHAFAWGTLRLPAALEANPEKSIPSKTPGPDSLSSPASPLWPDVPGWAFCWAGLCAPGHPACWTLVPGWAATYSTTPI